MCSFPETPPSAPSPLLLERALHLCKSLSSENRSRDAPLPVQSARIPRCPASSPTRLSPPADPGPNVSIFQHAPALPPRPAAAPLPSSVSTRNPPSFRPERRECLSPLRPASCMLLRRCCRIPPPRSPRCGVSAPPSTIPRLLSRSAGTPTPLCLSRAAKLLPAAGVPAWPSIPSRSFRSGFSARHRTSCASQTLSVSTSDPRTQFWKIYTNTPSPSRHISALRASCAILDSNSAIPYTLKVLLPAPTLQGESMQSRF